VSAAPNAPAARDLDLLDAVAEALSRHDNANVMLARALDAIGEHFGLETGWVWLLDAQTKRFYLAAERNLPPYLQQPVQMTGEVCWCMESFLDGDFASQNVDVIACSRLRSAESAALTGGLRHHASVVLRFGKRELGIMNLTGRSWHPLPPAALRLLSTVGVQIGMAIERIRLAEETANLARSDERARIAREMHDTLAQDLTAIGLQLEHAERHLSPGDGVRQRIEQALDVARTSLQRTRESLGNLRADPLGGRSLGSALAALTRRFTTETGILATLEVAGAAALSHDVEVQLYRIASEALANVERHARARRVDVLLRTDAQAAVLTIDDDGIGFDAGRVGDARYGIVGMAERAREAGGALAVRPRPGGPGTRVEARVPVPVP
jgi:two-component system, NarL family, sensor kinase